MFIPQRHIKKSCGLKTSYFIAYFKFSWMDSLETLRTSGDFSLHHLCAPSTPEIFHFILGLACRTLGLFTSCCTHSPPFSGLQSESYFGNTFPRSLACSILKASMHPLSKLWVLEVTRKCFPDLPSHSLSFFSLLLKFGMSRQRSHPFCSGTFHKQTNSAFLFPVFLV